MNPKTTTVLKTQPMPPVEKTLSVLIDPGHGGQDGGAIWKEDDGTLVFEKDINLEVARLVLSKLARHVETHITRGKDEFVALYNRAVVTFHYDLFVSIHCNAIEKDKWDSVRGTEVYVRSLDDERGVEIAKLFAEPVAKALGIPKNDPNYIRSNNNLRVLTLADRVQDRFGRSMSVLRRCKKDQSRGEKGHGAAAVLIELGYLTNKEDRCSLKSPQARQAVADAIARVINSLAPKPQGPDETEEEEKPLPDEAYTVPKRPRRRPPSNAGTEVEPDLPDES